MFEYLRLHQYITSLLGGVLFSSPQELWCPLDLGFLKVNTNVAFSEGRIGTTILVRNHLGIPLFANALQYSGSFFVGYGEFLGTIY